MDINNDFVQAKIYSMRLDELSGNVEALLNEFKGAFVYAKLYPNNQEYKQQFQGIINRLSGAVSQTFSVSNEVQKSTEQLNQQLFLLNDLIQKERKQNKQLKKKLGIVENQNNTSTELIDDYTEIYNQKYLRNWSLILSGLLCIMAIKVVYK